MDRMLKPKLLAAVSLLFVLVAAAPAQAAPTLYTFTGQVSYFHQPSPCAGPYCIPDVQVGTPVAFTVIIDFEGPPQGQVQDPSPNPNQIHYFYAEFVSGPLFESFYIPDPAAFNDVKGFGVDIPFSDSYGSYGSLFCGPNNGSDYGDSKLVILSLAKPVSQWAVGDTLFGSQFGGAFYSDVGYQLELTGIAPVPEMVTIDIRPWSKRNPINYRGHGILPVAILSTEGFDAPSQVDQDSLTFGTTGEEKSLAFCGFRPRDFGRDGSRDDLMCYFYVQTAGFKCGDTEGILKGKTSDGTPIEGRDLVRIVNCR
jgi:hypothetical protein